MRAAERICGMQAYWGCVSGVSGCVREVGAGVDCVTISVGDVAGVVDVGADCASTAAI